MAKVCLLCPLFEIVILEFIKMCCIINILLLRRVYFIMKKTSKLRVIAAALSMSLACSMLVTSFCATMSDAAKAPKLGFTKVTLEVGQKKKIIIKNKVKKATYSYKSSSAKKASVSRSGIITAKSVGKAKITVKQKVAKKVKTVGKVTVTVKEKKAQVTMTPAVTQTPVVVTSTPDTVTPTATVLPTAAPTKDVYTKEVFTIYMQNTEKYTVNGSTCDVEMQYFDAEADGEYFQGGLIRQNESSIVTKKYKDGNTVSCGRYILKGKDKEGKDCTVFIEDNSIEYTADRIITKPTIITDNSELSFLQTADIQGRIEDEGNGNRELHIMWNESNTDMVQYPTVKRPSSGSFTKELFTFTIGIGASDNVPGADGASASMINFTCSSNSDTFKGSGLANFVDTRMQFKGQVQTLSARYIMEGTDDEGNECKIYVENNGIDDNGMVTEPVIITDNPKWAYIETAPLHGTVSWDPDLTIHMWTTADAK